MLEPHLMTPAKVFNFKVNSHSLILYEVFEVFLLPDEDWLSEKLDLLSSLSESQT